MSCPMELNDQNDSLVARPATLENELWLWEQYSQLLGPLINKQWGWDEALQRSNFLEHLPYTLFTILEKQNSKVAAFAERIEPSRIYLHMLLVVLEHQSHGVGTHVINMLKAQSRRSNLPIELSVFSANPLTKYYKKHGFKLIEATAEKQVFRWSPE